MVILSGGVVNLAFAVLLAPRFQGIGMAVSVDIAETAICIALVWVVARTTTFFRKEVPSRADTVSFAEAIIKVPTRVGE
jgi:O-antigen/teichoic acid export membrane protein